MTGRVLLDSSAWVDNFRNAPTDATQRAAELLDGGGSELLMCEPIVMELLAGSTRAHVLVAVERLVSRLPTLSFDPITDFRSAAAIFRATRIAGTGVRNLSDCLIFAVAIRHRVLLVHKDADYEAIARATSLQEESLR